MDELIGRLTSKVGVDSAVAEKTIGIMLNFLRNAGPSAKVQPLIDHIDGAEAAIAVSHDNAGLARLMGNGLMATTTRLMGLGLCIDEIQNIAHELFRYGRDKIGTARMDDIIKATPGVNQFA
jgi:hypothetical protein